MILTFALILFGSLQLRTSNCSPINKGKANNISNQKNNTGTNKNNNGNNDKDIDISHYYHDYGNQDYGEEHKGHHEYEGGDDLFSHVKTNLTGNKDNNHIYHEYINYGFSQHGHETNNETDGNSDKLDKFLGNSVQTPSLSTFTTLIFLVVSPLCMFLIKV